MILQKGRLNVVLDNHAGSSGKGLITTKLAYTYLPEILTSTNTPNAGHTGIMGDFKFIAKVLPTPAMLNKIVPNYHPYVFIGASSGFEISQLITEVQKCGMSPDQVIIHPRAMIITDKHKQQEMEAMKHIGSTRTGGGAAILEKVSRNENISLVQHHKCL